jgi:tetratricopeptide (TPR) repeat protein
MTVGEMLDEAALHLGPAYNGPPQVESALRRTVGSVYGILGRFDQAEVHLDRAIAIERERSGAPGLLDAVSERGLLASRRGETEKARALAEQELSLARMTLGAESPRAARALLRLARTDALLGNYASADSLFELGWSSLAVSEPDEASVTPLRDYAAMLLDLGRFTEAEGVARRVHDLSLARHGAHHAETAGTQALLARTLVALGRTEEGIILHRDALETMQSILGDENREVVLTRNNLGQTLTQAGRAEEALPLFEQSLPSAQILFGPRHPNVADILRGKAAAQLALDSLEVAEASFREALEILREARGDHPSLCEPLNDHAASLRRLGRYAEAEPLFQEALTRARAYYGEEHVFVIVMMSNLATTRASLGRYDEAVETFEQAVSLAETIFPPARPEPDRIRSRYGECLMLAGRLGQAGEVLFESHAALEAKVGASHPYTRDAAAWLAELHDRTGDPAAAREWRKAAEPGG